MASIIDVCNMALSHIGSDAIVSSIDPPDGSVEAGHCARFFPLARAELLESFTWRWAKTRTQLAQVDNPSEVWAYAYAIPADMLSATRVLNATFLQQFNFFPFWSAFITADELALFNERGSADFDIEGDVLLTNEPEATLLYTVDAIDPSKWSPTFVTALSYLMASFLAGPLIKGSEGAKTGGQFRQIATRIAGQAAARDANSGAEPAQEEASSTRARL
jgi:hypothetical protein